MMKNTYIVNGMTCAGCERAVKNKLMTLKAVDSVEISLEEKKADLVLNEAVSLAELQEALGGASSAYQIKEG